MRPKRKTKRRNGASKKKSVRGLLFDPAKDGQEKLMALLYTRRGDPTSLGLYQLDPDQVEPWNPSGIIMGGQRALHPGLVFHFAMTYCPKRDLAELLGVDEQWLYVKLAEPEYAKIWKAGRAVARVGLSVDQMLTSKHDTSMQIFLGKQRLNQSDDPSQRRLNDEAEASRELQATEGQVFTVELTKEDLDEFKKIREARKKLRSKS